jgi:hypothetical protein
MISITADGASQCLHITFRCRCLALSIRLELALGSPLFRAPAGLRQALSLGALVAAWLSFMMQQTLCRPMGMLWQSGLRQVLAWGHRVLLLLQHAAQALVSACIDLDPFLGAVSGECPDLLGKAQRAEPR